MNAKVKFYKAKFILVWADGEHKVLKNGFIGVNNGKIESFGKQLPDGAGYEDLGTAAVVPGFIDLHCHPSEVFSIKSYTEDLGNPLFYGSTLVDLPFPVLGKRGAELQAKLNLAEILKSGATTALIFGGPYSRLEADTAGQMGMRAYVGAGIRAGDRMEAENIWDSPDGYSIKYNFNEEEGFKRIAECEELVKDYHGSYGGRVQIMLGPTQTMTCTPDMLKATRRLADKLGVRITIHGAEDLIEFEQCVRIFGRSPVQYMADNGMVGEDVVIAHCVYVQGHSKVFIPGKDDLKLLSDTKTSVAHSPVPFARIGHALESFSKYRDSGVNVGIGTDTFPSDIIQEMRLAVFMGKMQDGHTFFTRAKDIFDAATVNGAKALGRDDLGRLAVGAQADFVVFNLDTIEMVPSRDIVKNIIFSATRNSVRDVYVNGECVVKDGKVPGIDEKELCAELQEVCENAWKGISEKDLKGRTMDELYPQTYSVFGK